MPGDTALETMALEQKRWSLTANQLKKSIGMARGTILLLAIAGAILETLAAHIHGSYPLTALWIGYAGAAAIAVIAVIRQWRLGRDRLQAWVMARAASESFKNEMYLYRTSAGAYAQGNPAITLIQRRDQILDKARFAQRDVVEPHRAEVKTPGMLDAEGYIQERVNGQIDWFRKRADQYAGLQKRYGMVEFALAILGALLGAALSMTGTQEYGAWVAVITTIIGAASAHLLAQRYEQLIVSYRSTADRLTGIKLRWEAANGTLPLLAEQCEAVLLEENQGWIAGIDEIMKDNAQKKPAEGTN